MKRGDNSAWIVGGIAYVDVSTCKHPCAVTLIDAADLDLVVDGNGRWRAWQGDATVYVCRSQGRSQRIYLHRHVLGLQHGQVIMGDHENHDGLDNRRSNLRPATGRQNNANMRARRGASRFKGVYATPRGTWYAQIKYGGVKYGLGTFGTQEAAASAYDSAAREAFGSFACLNLPEELAA